jgi:short-subunit dehydrogenase
MNKVLLIGATSLVGQSILQRQNINFQAPTRDELDLTDPESINNYDYKNFDCLILVAGAGMRHGRNFTFEETEVDFSYIQNTIDVNCTGTTMLLKKYLSENRKGHVVVIGSMVINDPKNTNVVYSSSKVYLDRLIDLLGNLYKDTIFIKINPGAMQSRTQKDLPNSIPAIIIADLVWKCIDQNIKRLDIIE